jgi:monoterpene epsilon-lactone hydrolase
MNLLKILLLTLAFVPFLTSVIAQNSTPGPRNMPARTIPVPDTVSPQMQKLIAAPLSPTWNVIPKTADEWKKQVNAGAAAAMQALPALCQ